MKRNLIFMFLVSGIAAAFVCCHGSERKEKAATETVETSSAMEVDDLLKDAETLVGKEVTLSGVCTHICKHGGKKIFLMGSDDTQTIRIEAGEEIGSFKPETVNSVVEVTGILEEQRIDEAYLTDWETKLKNKTAEEHGEEEAGCAAEQKAHNETPVNSVQARIDNFRKRIADRQEKEGKNYLSFYYVEGKTYEIK